MRAVIFWVNQARTRQGLKPLRRSRSLHLTARLFGLSLRNRPLAHDATIHADRAWLWAGEVLARGQATAEEVVSDWLDSPAHRAILLSPKAKAMGSYYHRPSRTWVGHFGRLGR